MKYSDFLNKKLRDDALDAYQNLPDEFKQKTFLELEESIEVGYWFSLGIEHLQATNLADTCDSIYCPIKELVDKGVLDFEIDATLEEIVKKL